jgi:hypothetical protein
MGALGAAMPGVEDGRDPGIELVRRDTQAAIARLRELTGRP